MVTCPHCGTIFQRRQTWQNNGKDLAATSAGATAGAWIGARIGIALGPWGAITGTLPGALIGGLVVGLGIRQFAICPRCAHAFFM